MTVWASTQVPFDVRDDLAEALGLERERVRVIAPDVGGGFGAKLAGVSRVLRRRAGAASRLRRPVRVAGVARGEHDGLTHGRAQVHDVELGATRDGDLVGLRVDVLGDVGCVRGRCAPADDDEDDAAGVLPHRARRVAGPCDRHQRGARRLVPRRRTSRSDAFDRASDGPPGTCPRDGSGRAAAPQPDPRRSRTRRPSARRTTSARTTRRSTEPSPSRTSSSSGASRPIDVLAGTWSRSVSGSRCTSRSPGSHGRSSRRSPSATTDRSRCGRARPHTARVTRRRSRRSCRGCSASRWATSGSCTRTRGRCRVARAPTGRARSRSRVRPCSRPPRPCARRR